jgi:hypothetical protein
VIKNEEYTPGPGVLVLFIVLILSCNNNLYGVPESHYSFKL